MQKIDSNRRVSSMSFAGWLFADVLIVLFVVFIGSEVRHSRVQADTASPNSSSEVVKVGVLEPKPIEILINDVDQRGVRSGNSASIEELRNLLAQNPKLIKLSKRYSPITLVFSHYNGQDTSLGTKTSVEVCKGVIALNSSIHDGNTRCETYFDGSLAYGQVKLKIFLVAN